MKNLTNKFYKSLVKSIQKIPYIYAFFNMDCLAGPKHIRASVQKVRFFHSIQFWKITSLPNTYRHFHNHHHIYHHNCHPYPSHQHSHCHCSYQYYYYHNHYQYDHHYHQHNHHHLGHHLKNLLEYCHSGNEVVLRLTFGKLFTIKVPRQLCKSQTIPYLVKIRRRQ